MEQTIKDVMARVQGLRNRIEQQPLQASKDQLNAIHIALKGALNESRSALAVTLPPSSRKPART